MSLNSNEQTNYAPWPWRMATTLIDYAPVFVILMIGRAVGGTSTGLVIKEYGDPPRPYYEMGEVASGGPLWWWAVGASIAICLLNKGLLEGNTGKSVGKYLLGYRTQDLRTAEPIGPARAVVRWVLLNIDFALCLVGILWPIWDRKRQTLLSDRLTNSVVTKD